MVGTLQLHRVETEGWKILSVADGQFLGLFFVKLWQVVVLKHAHYSRERVTEEGFVNQVLLIHR